MTGSSDDGPYVPFSQRNGLEPIPPQLKIGEVSHELRRLVDYYISLEIGRESYAPYSAAIFKDGWKRLATDLHVHFFRKNIEDFPHGAYENQTRIRKFVAGAPLGLLFNFVEFLIRHRNCSDELKSDLAGCFVTARAAYRIIDGKYIAALGSDEQAEAYLRALEVTKEHGASGARQHLIDAGVELRNGRWAESVREAIHAVESTAVKLAPGTSKLGKALEKLSKRGLINARLKDAFEQLYAYTNDEKGVRHARVFEDAESQVDETDALFMLGACASFVTYLLARTNQINSDAQGTGET